MSTTNDIVTAEAAPANALPMSQMPAAPTPANDQVGTPWQPTAVAKCQRTAIS